MLFSTGALCADTPLIHDIAAFKVVQLVLHVVNVLVDLLHSPAVPHDLILVNLRGEPKPRVTESDNWLVSFTESSLGKEKSFSCFVLSIYIFEGRKIMKLWVFKSEWVT